MGGCRKKFESLALSFTLQGFYQCNSNVNGALAILRGRDEFVDEDH